MARYRFTSRLLGLTFNTPPRLEDAIDPATGKQIKVYFPPVRVKFADGYFETDDEYVAKSIREHKLFGQEIFALEDIIESIPKDVRKEIEAEAKAEAEAETEAKADSGHSPPLAIGGGGNTADLVEALVSKGVKPEDLMDKQGRISPAKVRKFAKKYGLL